MFCRQRENGTFPMCLQRKKRRKLLLLLLWLFFQYIKFVNIVMLFVQL